MAEDKPNRRGFLHVSAVAGTGILIAQIGGPLRADDKALDKPADKPEEDVSPPEDLMREHGVLKRVMLVYDEILRRFDARQDFPPEALADSAHIIRSFVEDYHEKLEEDYLFPRFEKANKLVDLVQVLKLQHVAGRKVTDVIVERASAKTLKDVDERAKVALAMRQFNRMYAPHEAREDTVLFPAFHALVSAHEYDALGEDFEKKENELFGQDGFEKMVDKVAQIEKTLGIYELSQFTPKI
jgi:hemerythrin-like domain-containing protein